jgi:hypothetical protein
LAPLSNKPSSSLSSIDLVPSTGSTVLIHPWSKTIEDEAPEEIAVPLPVNFGYALHYMEMTVEEAVAEYKDQFPRQVNKAFADSTQVNDLLATKGLKVFVPQNWDGINGIPPLKLNVRPDLPSFLKPHARPVNPKLLAPTKTEFNRLSKYMWIPSTSPHASCMVVAPKATHPFIRLCGDYSKINKYIETGHFPIPHVQHALEKICHFKVFLDLDWTNAFHQVLLHPETSALLSIQTPWGQVQPRFMPEGIGPASGILQSIVSEIFVDFEAWSIAIFDNLLILATDYDDAYRKLELVFDRCILRNVFLKLSKSFFGNDFANFFGYVCQYMRYELSKERITAIQEMPFPTSATMMRTFLGTGNFFRAFVPHFATLTAQLHDMVKDKFNWKDPSSWTADYPAIFVQFKEALINACALYYPDYDLEWIGRCDASLFGVAGLLAMLFIFSDGSQVLLPIRFVSQKFSVQATHWETFEQEAYSCYFLVHSCEYELRCKPFILETDHNNLLWMEASKIPKVIRWRVYLQGFSFKLRHIPGKLNKVADYLSRYGSSSLISVDSPSSSTNEEKKENSAGKALDLNLLAMVLYAPPSDSYSSNNQIINMVSQSQLCLTMPSIEETSLLKIPYTSPTLQQPSTEIEEESIVLKPQLTTAVEQTSSATANLSDFDVVVADPEVQTRFTLEEALGHVHGGRMSHSGIRQTWLRLNEFFPAHRIPYRIVAEFVATCPICQKDRLGMTDTLQPVIRHLKPPYKRSTVGADTLTITPTDKNGNSYLVVIVNHFTKHSFGYATPTHDAISTATALFQYFCTFGLVDSIITDPGSEFTAEVVQHLHRWIGIRHRFSLVDRHESNGVEGTNKLILRHLKALVYDERVRDQWSSPTILPLVFFILNSTDSSETGIIPFHATFGADDETYLRMPDQLDDSQRTHDYVRLLNNNLRHLTAVSTKYQHALVLQRTASTPPELQNQYQPGDYVLFHLNPNDPLPSKLSPRFLGPFEVVQQVKNDVEVRNLIVGNLQRFHVDRLKLFHGSKDQAFSMAQLDNDQFVVSHFGAYRGDPLRRTEMEFEVHFADGSVVWLPWSNDLFQTVQYEDFCRSHPPLYPLLHSAAAARTKMQEINKTPIDSLRPGDTVYVDLRSYGAAWYETLNLPDCDHKSYVVACYVLRFANTKSTKVVCHVDVFNETLTENHHWVRSYGSMTVFDKTFMVLVDHNFVRIYPQVLPAAQLASFLEEQRQNAF